MKREASICYPFFANRFLLNKLFSKPLTPQDVFLNLQLSHENGVEKSWERTTFVFISFPPWAFHYSEAARLRGCEAARLPPRPSLLFKGTSLIFTYLPVRFRFVIKPAEYCGAWECIWLLSTRPTWELFFNQALSLKPPPAVLMPLDVSF